MELDGEKLWRKSHPQIQETVSVPEFLPKTNSIEAQTAPSGFSSSAILSGGYTPLTFSQLNDYGLTILSERRDGDEEWESSYKICPLSDSVYKLSYDDVNIYLRRKIKSKPSFLKLYFKMVNLDSGKKMNIMIVKNRGGQKKIIFTGMFGVSL